MLNALNSWFQYNACRVLGDTCVAMQEWAANPRNGTSFDVIMKCHSSSHTSSSHLNIGEVPPIADDEVQYTEYKFLNEIEQKNQEFYDDHRSFSLRVKKPVQRKASTQPYANVDSCAQMQQAFVPIFDTIVTNNCPSMCRNAKWVWAALVTLSTGSMVSIGLWIVFTRRCTMRLTKVDGGKTPTFQLQESSKKKDAGTSYHNAGGAYPTGPSTPNKEDVNGGSRRRSKPKTVNININT